MGIERIEVARGLWRMLRVMLRDGGHVKHDSKMREAADIFEDELYNPPKSEIKESQNDTQQIKESISLIDKLYRISGSTNTVSSRTIQENLDAVLAKLNPLI